jgi:CRP-like cAMP-binding protein
MNRLIAEPHTQEKVLSKDPISSLQDTDALALIKSNSKIVSLRSKERLFSLHDNKNSLFIVKQGLLLLRSEHDGIKAIELVYNSNFLGALVMHAKESINCVAEAACDTEVYELTEEAFNSLLVSKPQLLSSYIKALGLYISKLNATKLQTNQYRYFSQMH